jgi:hypothetical protein
MIDNKIVIAKEKYDDETKMINLFFNEIIFMNNVEQFKKYYHGMSVTPPPPPPNPIVVNNIIYLLCTKLGCLENK